jgi:hypothetical protein
MYIDGVNYISRTSWNPNSHKANSFLIAAADGASPSSFSTVPFDEVRVWSSTNAAHRYVMNQIVNNASFTNGVVVPNTITLNDIKALPG